MAKPSFTRNTHVAAVGTADASARDAAASVMDAMTTRPGPVVAAIDEPLVKISIVVPTSVRTQLKERAFHDNCTTLHLIMKGLEATGFNIPEPFLSPDRRTS